MRNNEKKKEAKRAHPNSKALVEQFDTVPGESATVFGRTVYYSSKWVNLGQFFLEQLGKFLS
jgi:hypothetical protein